MNGKEITARIANDDENSCTFSSRTILSIKAQLFCGGFTGGINRDNVHAICKADCTGGQYSGARAQLFGQDHDCMLTTSYGKYMRSRALTTHHYHLAWTGFHAQWSVKWTICL